MHIPNLCITAPAVRGSPFAVRRECDRQVTAVMGAYHLSRPHIPDFRCFVPAVRPNCLAIGRVGDRIDPAVMPFEVNYWFARLGVPYYRSIRCTIPIAGPTAHH